MNAEVCIIKGYLCHYIKQAMSYHIMEFYVTTCHMSRLLWHPYYEPDLPHEIHPSQSIGLSYFDPTPVSIFPAL